MRVLIAGGTAFLGRPLRECLLGGGHTVVVLSRRPSPTDAGVLVWDPALAHTLR